MTFNMIPYMFFGKNGQKCTKLAQNVYEVHFCHFFIFFAMFMKFFETVKGTYGPDRSFVRR